MNDARGFPAQRGLSLIEIMVALAIGSLLILALVQVFAASRTAYQLSTGLARAQENARFAIDILQRDLRMAGHMGCVNDQARFLPGNVTASRPALISTFLSAADQFNGNYGAVTAFGLRFDRGIEAFEAVNTGSGSTVEPAATPVVATSAASWNGMAGTDLFDDLNAGSWGKPVVGSDVLVLRFFSPTGARVETFAPGNPATIEFTASHAPRLVEGMTNPGLFGIADCMQAAVFQASSANPGGGSDTILVGNAPLNNSNFQATTPFTTGQAMVYRAESVVYYVGLNANDNPALYRMRYMAGPNGALSAPKEELVEGIESLQLEFGQDSETAAAQRPTGNIASSLTANSLLPAGDPDTAWRRVGLVRLGLLARSTEPAAAAQRDTSIDGVNALSAVGVVFSPPDDTRYRAVYEDTVALRNRLFGN